MKYLLHIDTSTDIGIVAIGGDGKLLSFRTNEEQRNHAGTINLMINELLSELKISFEDLSCIVVCAGPGSYTGLRIGMATAKGICYAADKPLILDDRLTLLANQAYQKYSTTYAQYAVILMAREKEYFIAVYNNNFICTLRPQHILESQLAESIGTGENIYIITDGSKNVTGTMINSNIATNFETKIDINAWVSYAFEEFNCNKTVNSLTAEPFYLKQVYTHK